MPRRFHGYRWGPGWLDGGYDSSISTVGLLIGALYRQCAHLVVAQTMTLLTLVGAMAVPTLIGILQEFCGHLPEARYMMPLWIVFLFLLAVDVDRRGVVSSQAIIARRAARRNGSGRCSSLLLRGSLDASLFS